MKRIRPTDKANQPTIELYTLAAIAIEEDVNANSLQQVMLRNKRTGETRWRSWTFFQTSERARGMWLGYRAPYNIVVVDESDYE